MARSSKGSRLGKTAFNLCGVAKLGGPENSKVFQGPVGKTIRKDVGRMSGFVIPYGVWIQTFGVGTSWVELFDGLTTLYTTDWRKAIAWEQVVDTGRESAVVLPMHVFDIYDLLPARKGKGTKWYKRRVRLADRPCFCMDLHCPDIPRRERWIEERNKGSVPFGERWRQRVMEGGTVDAHPTKQVGDLMVRRDHCGLCDEELGSTPPAFVSGWGWIHDRHLDEDVELRGGALRPIELPGIGWVEKEED